MLGVADYERLEREVPAVARQLQFHIMAMMPGALKRPPRQNSLLQPTTAYDTPEGFLDSPSQAHSRRWCTCER